MNFDLRILWIVLIPLAYFLYIYCRVWRSISALNRAREARDRGDIEAARVWAQRAIERATSELERAAALDEMGGVHRFMGDNTGAENCYREALNLRRLHLPPNHGDIGASLHNLGLSCYCAGRFIEGESLFRQALESLRSARGQDDPSVALTAGLLGCCCMCNGKFAEATELLAQSLQATTRDFGDADPKTGEAHQRKGDCDMVCGRLGAADHAYCRTYEILERVNGARHPATLAALQPRAFLLMGLYRLTGDEQVLIEADDLATRFAAGTKELLGPEHQLTAGALTILSRVRTVQHRGDEAVALAREALRILRATIGPDHLRTAFAHLALARALEDAGQLAEATEEVQHSIAINERGLGKEHFEMGEAYQVLGSLAASQCRYQEAEQHLQRSLALHAPLGNTNPVRVHALRELAKVLQQLGRSTESDQAEQEAGAVLEEARREWTATRKLISATNGCSIGTSLYSTSN